MPEPGRSESLHSGGDDRVGSAATAEIIASPSHLPDAVLVSVPIEDDGAPSIARVAELRREERALVDALPPARRASFVAGRVALRAAVMRLAPHLHEVPLLRTVRGGPLLPDALTGSVSHKRHRAIAMAAARARAHHGENDTVRFVGVDLEERPSWFAAPTPQSDDRAHRLAKRILTARELAMLGLDGDAMPHAQRPDSPGAFADSVLLRFALKEAVYKAIDPLVQRYVRFDEVEIDVAADGRAAVRLLLEETARLGVHVAAEWRFDDAFIIASAEVSRSRDA